MPDDTNNNSKELPEPTVDVELNKVTEKVKAADSILVALSKNPTVDEIAAALGLTLALSKMGKHATAIYSGETPNVLAFLEPEKTFETDTNSLQDFIIALNKEKADHLRYKIEGDFVKVYITPYKTTIDEKDLEFSHGDVNVDLVISINVEEEEDLDAALATHGRIMHDASAVNISNAVPGRLGGIEWNKTNVSSVSEMIVQLLDELKEQITEDVATALLTGIEAATERFSNEKTTPEAMSLASKLMGAGADQQLIVTNIMQSAKKEEAEQAAVAEEKKAKEVVPGTIEVDHDEKLAETPMMGELPAVEMPAVEMSEMPAVPEVEPMAETPAEAPVNVVPAPVLESVSTEQPAVEPTSAEQQLEQMMTSAPAAVPTAQVPVNEIYQAPTDMTKIQDGTVPEVLEQPKDYGAMMEEALAEPMTTPAIQSEMPTYDNPAVQATPDVPAQPEVQPVEPMPSPVEPMPSPVEPMPSPVEPMLPPVDESSLEGIPTEQGTVVQTVPAETVNPVVVQPEPMMTPEQPVQDPTLVPPVQDPGAFKIPGM